MATIVSPSATQWGAFPSTIDFSVVDPTTCDFVVVDATVSGPLPHDVNDYPHDWKYHCIESALCCARQLQKPLLIATPPIPTPGDTTSLTQQVVDIMESITSHHRLGTFRTAVLDLTLTATQAAQYAPEAATVDFATLVASAEPIAAELHRGMDVIVCGWCGVGATITAALLAKSFQPDVANSVGKLIGVSLNRQLLNTGEALLSFAVNKEGAAVVTPLQGTLTDNTENVRRLLSEEPLIRVTAGSVVMKDCKCEQSGANGLKLSGATFQPTTGQDGVCRVVGLQTSIKHTFSTLIPLQQRLEDSQLSHLYSTCVDNATRLYGPQSPTTYQIELDVFGGITSFRGSSSEPSASLRDTMYISIHVHSNHEQQAEVVCTLLARVLCLQTGMGWYQHHMNKNSDCADYTTVADEYVSMNDVSQNFKSTTITLGADNDPEQAEYTVVGLAVQTDFTGSSNSPIESAVADALNPHSGTSAAMTNAQLLSAANQTQQMGSLVQQLDSSKDTNLHLLQDSVRQEREIRALSEEQERLKAYITKLQAAATGEQVVEDEPEHRIPNALPSSCPMHLLDPSRIFDEDNCGYTLSLSEDRKTVRATKEHSKTVLVKPAFDVLQPSFIQFTILEPYARYMSVGVVRTAAPLDFDRHSLGDSIDCWAYYGHTYWMAPLRHNEESCGPSRLHSWKVNDKIGIYVDNGILSFFLNGKCVITNCFVLPTTQSVGYSFAVSFGGLPDRGKNTFGAVSISN